MWSARVAEPQERCVLEVDEGDLSSAVMASRKRSRKKRGAAATRVAKPKKRLKVSFDVLGAVTRAADDLMERSAIENTPGNRVQASMYVRGINALKSVHALAEQSQWEFAAGPVRQVFELVINTEELLRRDDLDEALKRYSKFGLLQGARARHETLVYERDTGREYDADRLSFIGKMLEHAFPEFRRVNKKGVVSFDMTWCGKTTGKLAAESDARIRPHQYALLFSTWSEQVHASPSTMLDDVFGTKATDLEGLLQADEPKTAEMIAMGITLFIELWRLLPAIPDPDEGTVKGWSGQLIEEALRWRADGLPVPPAWAKADS